MKRTIFSLLAICATAIPAFCGTVPPPMPEPHNTSWIYGLALAGVAGFAFFKRNKSSK